ncbi:translation elongation factor Ts [candidate division CPR3 bacterium GWF2_35_18]|uniref:Elongation factor Ts n=1 Tax=candidate division CPR3 bacterium GW2011_GWF2_35_18 TaxID=1618350 RepID=A0A0G0BJ64_UNCC3|nr:MAG: Elongation factor Ts [candidate division CPR3 bacterium GW2011_GWF2_35_18]KKP85508.1 MAG: Elongation factor Ts [candidate division CPR3 bacterium GW2011_GWE2_35_7]OGB62960.1 MAG: translation elongation factor Ts [candidate division CPR3 bacterium GWF2_35_18]OGB65914.1 MAG: translation elongation factor Ts [candidate division CPR3 bacterium RIFOXYA2_FULL_35_13]OGB77180.1 MAG: translation elongation factor Ts [candidate division CPR3 bacterium RIFOXYC2_FULL_35_7]OGB79266.1 MAG: translati
MSVNTEDIKKLREETGAGVLDCKRALDESKGNFEKAKEIIKEKGFLKADKKASRETSQGLIETYVHGGGKVGVMLELLCETDFVARNSDFKKLAHELAMHIAAMEPKNIKELLKQNYIRDMSVTVEALIKQHIAKIGENIVLKRFERYVLGFQSKD